MTGGILEGKDRKEHLLTLAKRTLHHFEETTARVRETLAEGAPNAGNVLANMNVLTSGQAVDHLNANTQARLRELHSLLREPAIARVVTEDEEGARRIYFVSRATPHRSPTDGSLAVSYNATPLGRLAALPVGSELPARTRDGERSLRVLERALLHPFEESSGWDSRNSTVEALTFGLLTLPSLRSLLAEQGVEPDELDALDAALADDRAAALVVEGLQRDVIAKMELRDLAVLVD